MPISFEMEQVQSTLLHITIVARYLLKASSILAKRAIGHDSSKFDQGEWEYFVAHTAKLSELTYGSPEYKAELDSMRPAVEKHYAANRHHPEHYTYNECNGCFKRYLKFPAVCEVCGYSQFETRADISQMTLIDLLEMLCDWLAATKRHSDGDIFKSIESNQKRFGYSDELKSIFLHTIYLLAE